MYFSHLLVFRNYFQNFVKRRTKFVYSPSLDIKAAAKLKELGAKAVSKKMKACKEAQTKADKAKKMAETQAKKTKAALAKAGGSLSSPPSSGGRDGKIQNILDLSDKIVKNKKEGDIELYRPCEF